MTKNQNGQLPLCTCLSQFKRSINSFCQHRTVVIVCKESFVMDQCDIWNSKWPVNGLHTSVIWISPKSLWPFICLKRFMYCHICTLEFISINLVKNCNSPKRSTEAPQYRIVKKSVSGLGTDIYATDGQKNDFDMMRSSSLFQRTPINRLYGRGLIHLQSHCKCICRQLWQLHQ
jgi:hypothetical protein